MAASERSREKQTTNPEEMSVADLVGTDATAPVRVDRQRDEQEPDDNNSGLLRLSEMLEQAAEAEEGGSPSTLVTGEFPVDSLPPAPVAPTPATAHPRRSRAGLYAVIVLLLAGMAAGYFYLQKGQEADMQQLIAEQQRLQSELESARAKGTTDAKAAQKLEAIKTELAAKKAEIQEKQAEAPPAEKPTVVAAKPQKTVAPKKVSPQRAPKPAPAAPKKTAAAPKPAPKPASPAKTKDLSKMLVGADKGRPASTKPTAAGPAARTLSRAAIKKGMRPVEKKAQTCSRYAKGTVRVQITVAGPTGKVSAAKATGEFATNNAGRCVSMLARTAKFPTFAAPSQTFTHPIVLR